MTASSTPCLWMALTSLALAPLGCTGSDVTATEVHGTWVVTGPARASLPDDLRGAAAMIRLEQAGGFSAHELPLGLLGGPTADHSAGGPRSFSGSGTWTLVLRDGSPEVQLNFDSIGGSPNIRTPYGTQLHIWGQRPDILLYYSEGDPDEGRRIEFEKQR